MRTTVTLDPDSEALIRSLMRERGFTFKQAINEAIRAGLARARQEFRTPAFRMGAPAAAIDRALRLAGEMEDDELIRRLASGT